MPQKTVASAITMRGLYLSASMPPGICMTAYVQKNPLRINPSIAGVRSNSLEISGMATDNDARSM